MYFKHTLIKIEDMCKPFRALAERTKLEGKRRHGRKMLRAFGDVSIVMYVDTRCHVLRTRVFLYLFIQCNLMNLQAT